MKRILSLGLVLAASLIVLESAVVGRAQPKRKPKPLVAVMPFKVDTPGIAVDADWNEELKKSGKVRVLGLKQVEELLKANSFILDVTFDYEIRAKEVGKALGVKYLFTGSISIQPDDATSRQTDPCPASVPQIRFPQPQKKDGTIPLARVQWYRNAKPFVII